MSQSKTHEIPSSLFRIELLREDNWLPWKRRVTAILRERNLLKYVDGTAKKPKSSSPTTTEEINELTKWETGDQSAQTQIELTLSDAQMIHIAGAKTAAEMWEQLKLVKEARGQLGVLSQRRRLYRTVAQENTDIAAHITELRQIQEQLHMMNSLVSDEDFVTILITSLPESWDQFTTAYLGATGNKMSVNSHELIAILLGEYRRRQEKENTDDSAMVSRGHGARGSAGKSDRKSDKKSDVECWNCGKRGHTKDECWSKGGGKEGKGPRSRNKGPKRKERANQAQPSQTNEDLMDVAYHVNQTSEHEQFSAEFSRHDWLADSGTTSHISNLRETFVNFTPLESASIRGVGNQSVKALGRGTVILNCRVGNKLVKHQLQNVLYAPNAVNNLLSISRLDDAGGKVIFTAGCCELLNRHGQVIGNGRKIRRLYLLNCRAKIASPEYANIAINKKDSWETWHRRYGHLSLTGLQQLHSKEMVEGLNIDETSLPFHQCETCIQAKQHRRPYPKEANSRADKPGELTHSDVWGPARVTSINGSRYYISFTDDCKRRCTVLFMKNKSEAPDKIKEYTTYTERKFDVKLKTLRVDNGGEFINKEVKKWCQEKGIELQTTAPYSPSQNGIAERFNRTLIELARAMLIAKNLPSFLWEEAVTHAAYLRNRAPTRALQQITPEEAWSGRKPDISHLQEFGSDVWILSEGDKISKLQPKSKKYIFVGFMDGPKAVRYYDAEKRHIRVSRNYIFADPAKTAINIETGRKLLLEGENKDSGNQQSHAKVESQVSDGREPSNPDKEELTPEIQEIQTNKPTFLPALSKIPRRTARMVTDHDYARLNNPRAQPAKPREQPELAQFAVSDENEPDLVNLIYSISLTAGDEKVNIDHVPKTLKEAKASPEWPEWEKGVQAEMDILNKMGTWKLEELPKDRETVGCKWVFLKKTDQQGNITRYKARLVAQGFSQIPGMDFFETFAPVVRMDSVRAILAIAAIKDFEIQQLDVKGAYLNGDLEEEIYMRQPEGFDDGSGRVCRLYKTLYGLKQSGRVWNRKFHGELTKMGLSRCEVDHCVYIRQEDEKIAIITVWVDDLLLFTNSSREMETLKKQLKAVFEINDLGEPNTIIGIEIERNRQDRTISICQRKYINNILKRYNLQDANGVGMPLDPNVTLTKYEEPKGSENKLINGYASAIGSLMYAAIGTRPDIAFAVQTLSQFTTNPGPAHWTALKRVFRYLAGTRDLRITYGPADYTEIRFTGYSDADFAANPDDRKSISGYVFYLAGGAIAWSSKKQSTTALSSTEAEYTAISHATRQVIWLRYLFEGLSFKQSEATLLFGDNQSTIALTRDAQYHARSKHFDVQNHFVREKVEDEIIELYYCPTDEMVADIFTKALPRPKHHKFTTEMGLHP